jgi:pimeloyl-ACP methyl ester carboxylesterase
MAVFVLVGGAWLGGWCWDGVAHHLRARNHEVFSVTLTGLGERVHLARPETDLETHITDVVNTLDYEDLTGVVLVGHSYAGAVITGVADRRPERIAELVYLDTGPLPSGARMLDLFPPERQAQLRQRVAEHGDGWRLPMPGWEELNADASIAGLDDAMLDRLRVKATPQPFGTYTEPLALSRPPGGPYGRTAIFCVQSFMSVAAFREALASGHPMFQVFAGPDWRYFELDTGHWPMFSTPGPLADTLHTIATDPAAGR